MTWKVILTFFIMYVIEEADCIENRDPRKYTVQDIICILQQIVYVCIKNCTVENNFLQIIMNQRFQRKKQG